MESQIKIALHMPYTVFKCIQRVCRSGELHARVSYAGLEIHRYDPTNTHVTRLWIPANVFDDISFVDHGFDYYPMHLDPDWFKHVAYRGGSVHINYSASYPDEKFKSVEENGNFIREGFSRAPVPEHVRFDLSFYNHTQCVRTDLWYEGSDFKNPIWRGNTAFDLNPSVKYETYKVPGSEFESMCVSKHTQTLIPQCMRNGLELFNAKTAGSEPDSRYVYLDNREHEPAECADFGYDSDLITEFLRCHNLSGSIDLTIPLNAGVPMYFESYTTKGCRIVSVLAPRFRERDE